MAGVPYSDVVPYLLQQFPEFESSGLLDDEDMDLSYYVWARFGNFVTTHMRRTPADHLDDDPLVARVFALANELMDSDDGDTQTIVVIELLEQFYMYQKTLELARRKLEPRHVTWLERQGALLGTSNLHYEGRLHAANGLDALSAQLAGCSWSIKVRRHKKDPPYMEAYDERIELTTAPGGGPVHEFYGAVTTDPSPARLLLKELSERLSRGQVAHLIELYQTGRKDLLLERFADRWPVEVKAG